MARMVAPFTGVIHEVADSKVAARLEAGYVLLDGAPEPEPEPGGGEDEEALEQPAEPGEPDGKPTSDSTITEIRAWAEAHGVELPKKGNKAALLAAIG